jgi:toxin YoeB
MRKVSFSPESLTDLLEIISSDKTAAKRLRRILNEVISTPFEGIGQPEALKYDLSGLWSRRIDITNRFVYQVTDDEIFIISVKGH